MKKSLVVHFSKIASRMQAAYWKRLVRGKLEGYERIHIKSLIIGPDVCRDFEFRSIDRLSIGASTVINGKLHIDASGGVNIGHHCHIGQGLTVYSTNHHWRSTESIPYDSKVIAKPVHVGNCVWIGCNVTLLPGATIEDGAVIAGGSTVSGHVPEGAVYGGAPARHVGSRDMENYRRLDGSKSYF